MPLYLHVFGKACYLPWAQGKARGDKGARTVALHQNAFVHEYPNCITHRNAGNAQSKGKLTLGRQGIIDSNKTSFNRLLDTALESEIKRCGARGLKISYLPDMLDEAVKLNHDRIVLCIPYPAHGLAAKEAGSRQP